MSVCFLEQLERGKAMNKSNDSQKHVGLRKSLVEFSKQHFDISETINTTEKRTFTAYGGTENYYYLSLFNGKVYATENRKVSKALMKITYSYHFS